MPIRWIVLFLLLAGPANAGSRFVDGGPGTTSVRAKTLRSLAAHESDYRVCLRGRVPDRVRVRMDVLASGQIRQSRAQGNHPVAQCIAGVLAVRTLPAGPKGYRGVLEVATGTTDSATTSGAASAADLGPLRAAMLPCIAKAPAKARRVTVHFTGDPEGLIESKGFRVKGLDASGSKLRGCLEKRMIGARVQDHPLGKFVSYRIDLDLASSSTPSAAAPTNKLQPQKDGPVEGQVIAAAMDRHKKRFSSCYDRAAARASKGSGGHVIVRFTILASGKAHNVQIRESTLAAPRVERCLVKAVQGVVFPPEPGRAKTRVFYPFNYQRTVVQ